MTQNDQRSKRQQFYDHLRTKCDELKFYPITESPLPRDHFYKRAILKKFNVCTAVIDRITKRLKKIEKQKEGE